MYQMLNIYILQDLNTNMTTKSKYYSLGRLFNRRIAIHVQILKHLYQLLLNFINCY